MHIEIPGLQEFLDDAAKRAVNDALKEYQQAKGEEVEIIDTKVLCQRLKITEPTVIRWRTKGKIPYMQIGSAIRFDYRAVLKALEIERKGR